jgi:hypothetical protein
MSAIKVRDFGAHSVSDVRQAIGTTCIVLILAGLALAAAPRSHADPTGKLKSAVDSARGNSCPALQSDPVLNQLAQRTNLSTDSYIGFTTRSQPLGYPKADLLPALHQLGYNANKSKLLSGYGDPEIEGYGDVSAKATYGAVLQGYEAIPDCAYSKIGVDLFLNPSKGYALATVVLAGM